PRRVPLPPIDTPFEPIAWHRQQHVSTATLLATSTYPLSLSSTAVTSLATTPDLAFCHLGIENEGSPASVPPAHVVARAKLDQARENGVSLNTIADLEKKVTGLGDTLSAAADFGYQQRLAWLNLYLLASLVHLGITKLSSSEFGNNEAVFSLFTRVVHKFHELPDKLLWARNRGPGRVLFASTLHSSLTPAPVKVALMSLVRGTLLGSTPHMYRLLADAAVPTTYWTFRNFLRDPAVSARRGDAVHRSDLGNPTVYGSGTKITYNFAPQYYLSAPGLARALGFQHPATSPPKAAAPAATSSTAHLPPSQLAPPPSPLLSYSEALKIIECGFLGLTGEIELFSSSATQAYKAAQGKKGHAPWEAAPPDGDETLEWEHERYQSGRDSFGNAWALPQIKGDLTSTLLAADFAYAGLCQMPTKAEYAARILALGKGGYRGLVELGFIASAGANAFESFVTHMRASWADGGMHSSVKQALAANDVHLDLPHLEHLLCKIGRPEWLAFLKDADFPLLLKLAPCIINLSAPTWAVHLAAANV
ncbi:uncharacterized protein JCM10292_003488, partial [Rhodotorula paludigena]|uniref:uncharacterized protein n=1 Tax=Rhodotorula paludigena TaxID=86838 RepID=UPI003171AF15